MTSLTSPEEERDELVEIGTIFYPLIRPIDPIEGVTFGLELLLNTTHLFIRPAVDLIDNGIVAEDEFANHYEIIDANVGRILYAWETDVEGIGKNRSYVLKIFDYEARPVLQVKRTSGLLSCLLRTFNCFGTTGCFITINTPDGEKMGEVVQKYNGWRPKFTIQDPYEKFLMTILGPSGGDCCYNFNMMTDAEFEILNEKGEKIGTIEKGCSMQNSFDDRLDTFGVRFPNKSSVEEKAALLGTVFALDFMYFEKIRKKNPVEVYEQNLIDKRQKTRQECYERDLKDLGMKEEVDPDEPDKVPGEKNLTSEGDLQLLNQTRRGTKNERRFSIVESKSQ